MILTYSGSIPKEGNFIKSALIVALLNFVFCLVAGLVIFTFIFGYGTTPDGGPGLVFISLPLIFANTSTVSMLESLNTWLIDRFCFSRTKANILTISVAYGLGVLLLLSNTANYHEILSFFGKTLFKWFGYISVHHICYH